VSFKVFRPKKSCGLGNPTNPVFGAQKYPKNHCAVSFLPFKLVFVHEKSQNKLKKLLK
jgi:hypothetical protein